MERWVGLRAGASITPSLSQSIGSLLARLPVRKPGATFLPHPCRFKYFRATGASSSFGPIKIIRVLNSYLFGEASLN